MSLINEALKKAQRNRANGAAQASSGTDANGPVVKRDQPKSAKTTLLIVSGGVLLVVVSMVATAFWLSQPNHPAVENKPRPPAVAVAPDSNAPRVVVPPITPAPAPAPAPAPTPVPPTPSATTVAAPAHNESAAVAVKPATPPSMPSAPETKPIVPAESAHEPTTLASAAVEPKSPATPSRNVETAPTAKPDERVHQFVEAIHVTGIRASGSDSKVLMNDRVYRVNDMVDHSLGVRLTKVSNDSLTFTDANGVTYVKYF